MLRSIFLLIVLAVQLHAQQATVINNLQIIAITNATDVISPFAGAPGGSVTVIQPATTGGAPSSANCTDNCPECRFQSYSEGQWGDACSATSQAGCLLQSGNFTQCFPRGAVAGCAEGFTITINQPNLIIDLLPAAATECGNDPAFPGRTYNLRSSSTNPTSFSEAGHLAGQMISMTLNLGFDRCLAGFSEACRLYESLFLCDTGFFSATKKNPPGSFLSCTAFYNMTVRQVFDTANDVLGGCRPACENPSLLAPGISNPSACIRGQDLLNCALMINEGFAGNNILSTAPWFSLNACPARNARHALREEIRTTVVVPSASSEPVVIVPISSPTTANGVVVPTPTTADGVVVVVAASTTNSSATQAASVPVLSLVVAFLLALFLRS